MKDRQPKAGRRARWTGRIGAATLAFAASGGAAFAQYYEMQVERPRVYVAPRVYDSWEQAPRVYRAPPAAVNPGRAVGILLTENGYRAAGPAVRNGDVFIVPAEDRRGRRFRMVVDIYAGEILERFAMAGPNSAPRPPRAIGRGPAPDDEFAPVGRRATRDLRAPETRGLERRDSVASRPLPLPDDTRLSPGAGPGLAPDDDDDAGRSAAPARRAEPKAESKSAAKPAAKSTPRQARAKPDAKPEPVKEAARTEPTAPAAEARVEPAPAKREAAKPDVAKPDVAKPDVAKAEPSKPEAAKPDVAKAATPKAEPSKVEGPKPEVAKAEPASKPEASKPAAKSASAPAVRPGTKPMANSSILRRPSAKADDASTGPKTQSADADAVGTRRAPRVVYPGPGTSQTTAPANN